MSLSGTVSESLRTNCVAFVKILVSLVRMVKIMTSAMERKGMHHIHCSGSAGRYWEGPGGQKMKCAMKVMVIVDSTLRVEGSVLPNHVRRDADAKALAS